MVVGAVDPMEGSIVILPGAATMAIGAWIGRGERRVTAYRLGVLVLITLGLVALWGLSGAGGFGGDSGRSMWWGMLILPYLVGWSMGIWGPGSPRWLVVLGVVVGLWYLVIPVMMAGGSRGTMSRAPAIAVGATGLLTIAGCVVRLRKRVPTHEEETHEDNDV